MPVFSCPRLRAGRGHWFAPSLLLLLLACSGDGMNEGEPVPPNEFIAIRLDPNAPPLCSNTVSFVARRGSSTEGQISFCDPVSGEEEDEFLEFKVGSNTLLRRPDGTLFALGDTITITITVADPSRAVFDFQPTGLMFNPADPAELEISYRNCDRDFDDDGDEDENDLEIEQILTIFRQESPDDPWVRIGTAVVDEIDEVEADIVGFTRYAIAY